MDTFIYDGAALGKSGVISDLLFLNTDKLLVTLKEKKNRKSSGGQYQCFIGQTKEIMLVKVKL